MDNFGSGTDQDVLVRQTVSIDKPTLFHKNITESGTSSIALTTQHWTNIKLTLRDDIANRILTLVDQQMQKQATTIDHQFSLSILSWSNDVILDRWSLEGCHVASVNYGNLDYDSSNS